VLISKGINEVLNLTTLKGYSKQLAAYCTHRDYRTIFNSGVEVVISLWKY
jgi:hypothetical protein